MRITGSENGKGVGRICNIGEVSLAALSFGIVLHSLFRFIYV